jgi:tRNA-specific 2-thiouridylase
VTVGQRHGLGLPGGGPLRYAIDVDVASATVVVGEKRALLASSVRLAELCWSGEPHVGNVLAQCSAHGTPRPGTFDPADGTLTWDEPQRRVAPGQAVVLYAADHVLGGGIATPGPDVVRNAAL